MFTFIFLRIIVLPFQKVNKVVCVLTVNPLDSKGNYSVTSNQGFLKDQFRTAQGLNSMASLYRGSGGGAPSGSPGDRAPGEAECLFVFVCPKEAARPRLSSLYPM